MNRRLRGVIANDHETRGDIDPHRRPAAFPAGEARRVLDRLEFHYVPKHASWLNMVEIEIGVLRILCLDRRIGTRQRLQSEILAWKRQ